MDQQQLKPQSQNRASRKGQIYGQKLPLKVREIWAIRNHLHREKRHRDLALFNLGIDSKHGDATLFLSE